MFRAFWGACNLQQPDKVKYALSINLFTSYTHNHLDTNVFVIYWKYISEMVRSGLFERLANNVRKNVKKQLKQKNILS